MGMHLYTYIGPYLLVPPKRRPRMEAVRACPTPQCKKAHSDGSVHCSQCGSKLETRQVRKGDELVSAESVLGQDELWEPQLDEDSEAGSLIPVVRSKVDRSNIAPGDIVAETAGFRAFYAGQIARAQAEFDRAEVRWGLVKYWS